MKKYTAKYFRDNIPEWKWKKETILGALFYRRVSFYTAAFLANHNVSANTVSYLSGLVGLIGSALFLLPYRSAHIIGAILFNIWIIMDCTDGNLARNVKKQPFGEFADGLGSYILVAFMGSMIGVAAYFEGGLLIDAGCPWIILLGALGSTSDTLMRLIYQKYKATEIELANKKVIEISKDERLDHSKDRGWKMRLETEFGIGGILPFLTLVLSIFGYLDIIVFYIFTYYGLSCLAVYYVYVRKAIAASKKYADKMPHLEENCK